MSGRVEKLHGKVREVSRNGEGSWPQRQERQAVRGTAKEGHEQVARRRDLELTRRVEPRWKELGQQPEQEEQRQRRQQSPEGGRGPQGREGLELLELTRARR